MRDKAFSLLKWADGKGLIRFLSRSLQTLSCIVFSHFVRALTLNPNPHRTIDAEIDKNVNQVLP